MTSRTTRRFRGLLAGLPVEVRQQAKRAYARFVENPHHPGLQFKRIHSTRPIYSVRITLNYRAVGTMAGDEILWYWIGPHEQYERLIDLL